VIKFPLCWEKGRDVLRTFLAGTGDTTGFCLDFHIGLSEPHLPLATREGSPSFPFLSFPVELSVKLWSCPFFSFCLGRGDSCPFRAGFFFFPPVRELLYFPDLTAKGSVFPGGIFPSSLFFSARWSSLRPFRALPLEQPPYRFLSQYEGFPD